MYVLSPIIFEFFKNIDFSSPATTTSVKHQITEQKNVPPVIRVWGILL